MCAEWDACAGEHVVVMSLCAGLNCLRTICRLRCLNVQGRRSSCLDLTNQVLVPTSSMLASREAHLRWEAWTAAL